jgi:glutathione peroxidase
LEAGRDEAKVDKNFYDFSATALNGKPVAMSQYAGKVLLVVNTASHCGFTPQYTGLQQLHTRFAERGFEVLGFPCNQFGRQEPGDSQQIGDFCTQNFGLTFPLFEKVEVNGERAHPLFRWLTGSRPGVLGTEAIKWNFTKFLVDRQGAVIARYAPITKPESIAADIEKLVERRSVDRNP